MTKLGFFNLNGTTISGSIEDFVASQYDNGRTTGSITVYFNTKTNITFQGAKIIPQGKTLSWTSKTNITLT